MCRISASDARVCPVKRAAAKSFGIFASKDFLGMSTRWRRARDRAYRRAMREHVGATCAFCLEDLIPEPSLVPPVVTTCNHVFHGTCWRKYIGSKQTPPTAGDNESSVTEVLRNAYILDVAGPPCPICRRYFPTVHTMAERYVDARQAERERRYSCCDTLSVDKCLRLAEISHGLARAVRAVQEEDRH